MNMQHCLGSVYLLLNISYIAILVLYCIFESTALNLSFLIRMLILQVSVSLNVGYFLTPLKIFHETFLS